MIKWLMNKIIGPILFPFYKKHIIKECQELYKEQLSNVQNMMIEGLESGLELNIIINPSFMAPLGMYLSTEEEEEEEKVNPFKLVKDDEE